MERRMLRVAPTSIDRCRTAGEQQRRVRALAVEDWYDAGLELNGARPALVAQPLRRCRPRSAETAFAVTTVMLVGDGNV